MCMCVNMCHVVYLHRQRGSISHASESEIRRCIWFPLRPAARERDDLTGVSPQTMLDYAVKCLGSVTAGF